MSAELLKIIFDWGTVILLFLTFAFGAGALITGNILSERQSKQLQQFDKDLTDAKLALGKQQERAAKAERALLELQQSLADRDIAPQQRDRMLAVLRTRTAGHIVVQSLLSGGREALQYAVKIAAVFRAAGWDVPPPDGRGAFGDPVSWVFIVAGQNSRGITDFWAEVLIAGDISKAPVGISPSQNTVAGTVEIWVAGKPPQ